MARIPSGKPSSNALNSLFGLNQPGSGPTGAGSLWGGPFAQASGSGTQSMTIGTANITAGTVNLNGAKDKEKEDKEKDSRGLAERIGTAVGRTIQSQAKSLFGAASNSQASGHSVLGGAFDVLANTIGTVLMPVFVVLAAGVTALGDYLWGEMKDHLEEWVDMVIDAADAAADFVDYVRDKIGDAKDVADTPGRNPGLIAGGVAGGVLLGPVGAVIGGAIGSVFDPEPTQKSSTSRFKEEKGAGFGRSGLFANAMGDVLRELQLGIGGKASRGSLTSIREEAQMAAFQSPFQQRMLDRTQKMLDALNKVAANTNGIGLSSGGEF